MNSIRRASCLKVLAGLKPQQCKTSVSRIIAPVRSQQKSFFSSSGQCLNPAHQHKFSYSKQALQAPTAGSLASWQPRSYMSTSAGPMGKGFDITEGPLPGDEGVPRLSVRGFGDYCFQINETQANGSIILLPKTFYIWDVKRFEDITIESLSVFTLIHPTIEVLFIGCGVNVPGRPNPEIVKGMKEKGIIVEFSSSINAASTFNVLNAEGRNVAAALIAMPDIEDEEDGGYSMAT